MKQIMHIPAVRLSRLAQLLILTSSALFSQPSVSNQIVTLEVLELNKIFLSKDLLALEPVAVLERSAERSVISGKAQIVWTSNGGVRKISITSRQASSSCIVRVSMGAVYGSTAVADKLELHDASTRDLIQGLSKCAGSCEVRFMVVTDDLEPVRPHVHAIVYTVTSS